MASNGRMHGPHVFYYSNGQKVVLESYANGRKDGEWDLFGWRLSIGVP